MEKAVDIARLHRRLFFFAALSRPAALQFSPHRNTSLARERGCFTCTNFHGTYYAEHLLCEHLGGRQVIGTPKMGCAFWEREPGSDDE